MGFPHAIGSDRAPASSSSRDGRDRSESAPLNRFSWSCSLSKLARRPNSGGIAPAQLVVLEMHHIQVGEAPQTRADRAAEFVLREPQLCQLGEGPSSGGIAPSTGCPIEPKRVSASRESPQFRTGSPHATAFPSEPQLDDAAAAVGRDAMPISPIGASLSQLLLCYASSPHRSRGRAR